MGWFQRLARPTPVGYFRSFAAYDIPRRPQGPISFEETKGLPAYFKATYDAAGRLESFAKVFIECKAAGELRLPEPQPPGTLRFFEAIPDTGPTTTLGQPMDYAATAGCEYYHVGRVSPSGREIHWELRHRKESFHETYHYSPSGALLTRSVIDGEGRTHVFQYDEAGKQIRPGAGLPQDIPDWQDQQRGGPALA